MLIFNEEKENTRPSNTSGIWFDNLDSIMNNMENTKSLMIDMKLKDVIKLDIIELHKSETYP